MAKFPVWWRWKRARFKQLILQNRQQLNHLENPYQLSVLYAGFQGAAYLALYNFMRLGLETQRANSDLFIINLRALDYAIIALFGVIGLVAMLVAQYVAPYKWRQ